MVSEADAPVEQLAAPDDLAGTQFGKDDMPGRGNGHDLGSPDSRRESELRQQAIKERIAGKGKGKIHRVAGGQYVELGLERTDRVFVIIVENGNSVSTNPSVPTYNGPLHNQIAEPNRATNNTTIWQANYDRAHYEDMYFRQMVDYFGAQSSGRYTIEGAVTEWVKVPFNGARYGSNTLGDAAAWTLIADAINVWTQDQLASGKTLEEVTNYLKTFDVWDRYDYNANGNFDEPDGYIDHFQIVHSGVGEETGGGAQGANAIWSHRWAAFQNRRNIDGPSYNKRGGVEFGGGWGANPTGAWTGSSSGSLGTTNPSTSANVVWAHPATPTGIWVYDYTIQPENGGLGVFAHEYGHDLGLPDHYDTNSGDNGTGFWTIMSVGSYLGDGNEDIGSRPGDMFAWDKLQLGWLKYDVAQYGEYSEHKLGPAETNTKKAQAVVIPLPKEMNDRYVVSPLMKADNYGTKSWFGGYANNLDTSMTRALTVPDGTSTLNMRINYQIESAWDYAYVSVSTDGGTNWTNLAGSYLNTTGGQSALTTTQNPNGTNLGNGITGSSANAVNAPFGWRLASFNMTPYAGQNVLLRVRYKTDEATLLAGVLVDEVTLNGEYIDGAEGGDNGWTLNGWTATNGKGVANADHYYIAEYRQYVSYDETLRTGPYGGSLLNGYTVHYPYQDGLLVTYWDTSVGNNNTSLHPGEGRILPIDAHPEPMTRRGVSGGGGLWNFSNWSSRYQVIDATFGLEDTDPLNIPFLGTLPGAIIRPDCRTPVTSGNPPATTTVCQMDWSWPSLPGVPVFDDRNSYWSADTAASSTIVPNTGTTIRVENTSAQGMMMKLIVNEGQ